MKQGGTLLEHLSAAGVLDKAAAQQVLAEILPERDQLIICISETGRGFWPRLFLRLAGGGKNISKCETS